jgi:hypothetical protein
MINVSTFCGKYSVQASSHKYLKVSIGFVMSVRPTLYICLAVHMYQRGSWTDFHEIRWRGLYENLSRQSKCV